MESYEPAPLSKRLFAGFIAAFIVLFALTVALPHSWLPLPAKPFAPLYDWLANNTARLLWRIPVESRDESDSPGMFAHVLNLAGISMAAAPGIAMLLKSPRTIQRLRMWLPRFCAYLLAWQLLHYGFNKVFKWQFYRPEPNIQYSRITDLSPDILYWTTMGTSRGYCIFLGSIELLAATLLLIRRFHVAGALLSAGILANVLAVNAGFGITVKILSSYLMLITLVIVWNGRSALFPLLGIALPVVQHVQPTPPKFRWAKLALVAVLLSDALLPYLRTANFNDDADPRPPLHGAYAVAAESPRPGPWKRAFIHRRGYFILQDSQDRFHDLLLSIDTGVHVMWVSKAASAFEQGLDYTVDGPRLRAHGRLGDDSLSLVLLRLPLRY